MRVLLGVGGSELSYEALDETLVRAAAAGDELTVAVFDGGEEGVGAVETAVRERIAESGAEVDPGPEVRRIEGDPGSELVALAEAEGFDRIVLGAGERSPLGKIKMGPVAEFVLLNAQLPVTLIR
jgi:nucleotide-binding universal stress UspA family protein